MPFLGRVGVGCTAIGLPFVRWRHCDFPRQAAFSTWPPTEPHAATIIMPWRRQVLNTQFIKDVGDYRTATVAVCERWLIMVVLNSRCRLPSRRRTSHCPAMASICSHQRYDTILHVTVRLVQADTMLELRVSFHRKPRSILSSYPGEHGQLGLFEQLLG